MKVSHENETARTAARCAGLRRYVCLGKDAGWQWYNEPLKTTDPDPQPNPQPPQQMDILQKQAALQQATKKH
jgi:hypothetical protein